MKNIKKTLVLFMTLVLTISLVGCKTKKSKESSQKLEAEVLDMMEEERIEAVLTEFNELIANKEVKTSEIIAFVDENIEDLDKDNADRIVLELEEILIKNLEGIYGDINEKKLEPKIASLIGENIFIAEEKLKESKDEELKEFIKKIHEEYYKVMVLKDELDVIVDYDKLLKYNEDISEKIGEYFSIQALSTNEPILCDGSLNISYEDLSKRLVKIEKYVRKYPHEERYEKMLRRYKNGLVVYLKGSKNSPVIEGESKKFKKEVLNSYKDTAKNKEDITSYIVRKYLELIRDNDDTMNENVEKSVLSLVNEAIYHLEDSKE